jgi:uncharacterized membrane protein YbhN (UPF0104 family)
VAAGPASVNRAALLAAVGNRGFDLAVLAALRAGSQPEAVARAPRYTAAEVLALVPATPGLGFVEAGLVGTLGLAAVPAADALTATLLYRISAFWLPLPAGGIAYVLFRRRYRARR